MKPFQAPVQDWSISHERERGRRRGRSHIVNITLQVVVTSRRLASSIGSRLSKQLTKHKSVAMGSTDLVDAITERDAAYEYLERWQRWSLKLHRKLGLVDELTHPDDTKGRAKLQRLILANVQGCRMGVYCHEHGHVHGAEAENLRAGLEKLIATPDCDDDMRNEEAVSVRELQRLLDEVDARDSLAYLEIQDRRDAGEG